MSEDVIVKIGSQKYTTEVIIDKHTIIADEPVELEGQDLGPKPTLLFLSSLGTCKAITMRMYADLKQWPLESIEIHLGMDIVKDGATQVTNIKVEIKLIGDLDSTQRERILKVSEKCPVHKIITNPINIESYMVE